MPPAAVPAPTSGCRSAPRCSACPIERTVGEEGSAFGAALLGGVAGGVFADVHEAVAATVRPESVVEPIPTWLDSYTEIHSRYRALYPALAGVDAAAGAR